MTTRLLSFLPVVARELSVLARRKSTYRARLLTASAGILVMFWIAVAAFAQVSASEQGKSIFLILTTICFGYALLVGVVATSDCLSEEKREGTLGLLFLTDLRGYDIVFGKLAASSCSAAFALLGVVPPMALALLLGGVALAQVGLMTLALFNTLFLSLAAGVFISSISQNERKAMFGVIAILLALAGGPYIIAAATSDFSAAPELLCWPSPVFAFVTVHQAAPPGAMDFFWLSISFNHALAWGFLAAASALLPRAINQLPTKKGRSWRDRVNGWVYGGFKQRLAHRRALLDKNAFLWLASRERIKPRYAWVVLLCFAALYAWVWFQFPSMAFDLPVAATVMFLVHFLYKIWLASEVCSRLIDDRRSGALELLLSSPLSVRDIARGQSLALRRIFARPLTALILIEALLAWLCLRSYRADTTDLDVLLLFAVAVSSLFLDLWALKWVGLWNSLFGKSIERILLATTFRVLELPWIIFLLGFTGGAAVTQAVGIEVDKSIVIFSWWLLGAVTSVLLGFTSRASFLRHFREAAAARYDSRPMVQGSVSVWAGDLAARFARLGRFAGFLPRPVRQHWVLSGVTAFVLLLIGAGFIHQLYWKTRTERLLAEVRARGEPVNLLELSEYYPAPESRSNVIDHLRNAGAANMLGRNIYQRVDHSGTPNGDPFLRVNKTQLEALLAVTNFARAYLPARVGPIWNRQQDLPQYIYLGQVELEQAVHDGDALRFERMFTALLHLGRLIQSEPAVELQGLCDTLGSSLVDVLEMYLARNDLDEPMLLRLAAKLAEAGQAQPFRPPGPVMLAITVSAMQSPDLSMFFGSARTAVLAYRGLLIGMGARDRALYHTVKYYQDAASAWSLPSAQRLARLRELDVELQQRMTRAEKTMLMLSGPILTWVTTQQSAAQARWAVMRAAIQVRLGPASAETLPSDPFSGEPMRLLKRPKDRVVYSIGPDGVDNQGTAMRHLWGTGDLALSVPLPPSEPSSGVPAK